MTLRGLHKRIATVSAEPVTKTAALKTDLVTLPEARLLPPGKYWIRAIGVPTTSGFHQANNDGTFTEVSDTELQESGHSNLIYISPEAAAYISKSGRKGALALQVGLGDANIANLFIHTTFKGDGKGYAVFFPKSVQTIGNSDLEVMIRTNPVEVEILTATLRAAIDRIGAIKDVTRSDSILLKNLGRAAELLGSAEPDVLDIAE